MTDELREAAGAREICWAEEQRGERKRTQWDELTEAACYEAQALDWIKEGWIQAANEARTKAATLLLRYLQKRATAA